MKQEVVSGEESSHFDLKDMFLKMAEALSPATSVECTLELTAELILLAIQAERVFVFVREGGDLNCRIARSRRQNVPAESQPEITTVLWDKMIPSEPCILDLETDDLPFHLCSTFTRARSAIVVPLTNSRETVGMIYVDNPLSSPFQKRDLETVLGPASVASIKIEHAQMLKGQLANHIIEEQLQVAAEIQGCLQPVASPKINGWDIAAASSSYYDVGGDYYDLIQDDAGNQLTLAVGDVCGKGIGAALLMAALHAAVRAESRTGVSPSEIVNRINRYFTNHSPSDKFVSLIYGRLDSETGRFTYSNAGHHFPILLSGGRNIRLAKGGPLLGLRYFTKYQQEQVQFEPGDVLVIYSDGITEAANYRDVQFAERRLLRVVRSHMSESAVSIRQKVEGALLRFLGTARPTDDRTLMIVKRTH